MKKTRDIIQAEALQALKTNGYNGTCVINTGGGKGKVAIDAIKEGKFKSILITSPRTNLKTMWRKELDKWGISLHLCDIEIINIQTCYKLHKEELKEFDIIIADEVHLIASPEYSKLIVNARELSIPVIALTATPSLHDTFKEEFYKKYIPIVYEYHNSAKDGIINKRRYFIYQYELSNDYKVIAGTKKKPFTVGEKSQYEYLSQQIKKGQILMAQTGSTDWFKDAAYWGWGGNGTSAQRGAAIVYLNAIKYRKEFLWNLSSSADIAVKVKDKILNSQTKNKVLLFSELTTQANKLSAYSVHSKQDEETNKQLLYHFDTGKIRELSSVNSLTLGLNLVGANWAILESYNSSATSIQQKLGRTDRLKSDDVSNIVIIVPKSTQAEQWFNEFSKSLDLEDAIFINELKDLEI